MVKLIADLQEIPGSKEKRSFLLVAPCPELADDTLIAVTQLPVRIKNALVLQGFRTVGEVRMASDKDLVQMPQIGKASIEYLRCSLGLPSSEGVRAEPVSENVIPDFAAKP